MLHQVPRVLVAGFIGVFVRSQVQLIRKYVAIHANPVYVKVQYMHMFLVGYCVD